MVVGVEWELHLDSRSNNNNSSCRMGGKHVDAQLGHIDRQSVFHIGNKQRVALARVISSERQATRVVGKDFHNEGKYMLEVVPSSNHRGSLLIANGVASPSLLMGMMLMMMMMMQLHEMLLMLIDGDDDVACTWVIHQTIPMHQTMPVSWKDQLQSYVVMLVSVSRFAHCHWLVLSTLYYHVDVLHVLVDHYH